MAVLAIPVVLGGLEALGLWCVARPGFCEGAWDLGRKGLITAAGFGTAYALRESFSEAVDKNANAPRKPQLSGDDLPKAPPILPPPSNPFSGSREETCVDATQPPSPATWLKLTPDQEKPHLLRVTDGRVRRVGTIDTLQNNFSIDPKRVDDPEIASAIRTLKGCGHEDKMRVVFCPVTRRYLPQSKVYELMAGKHYKRLIRNGDIAGAERFIRTETAISRAIQGAQPGPGTGLWRDMALRMRTLSKTESLTEEFAARVARTEMSKALQKEGGYRLHEIVANGMVEQELQLHFVRADLLNVELGRVIFRLP